MQVERSRSPADDLARECLYRFLAAVVRGPYSDCWVQALDASAKDLALAAAEWLGSEAASEPKGHASRPTDRLESQVASLIEDLRAPLDESRAEYDRVFGLIVPKECPPYETEYYPTQETFARSQQMADIAGFYRAFAIEPASSSPERPDHLALELEFMAFLLMKAREASTPVDDPEAVEQASICHQAQRAFLRDHLAWWVPTFAVGLRHKAGGGYHETLAGVLTTWVPDECRRLGIDAVLRPAPPELIEQPEEQSGCAACPLLT